MKDFHMDNINAICPNCGNGKYMYHMSGKNVGSLNMKCTNCNSYFTQEVISTQTKLSNNSPKLDKEIGECNDCIKNGGDWECDRVHCHKGDVPDMNVGDLISRQAAIDAIDAILPVEPMKNEYTQGITCGAALAIEYVKQLPSAQKTGRWIDGMCSECEESTQDFLTNFCPNCGADMREGGEDRQKKKI